MTEQAERLVGPAEALELARRETAPAAEGTPFLFAEADFVFSAERARGRS